MKKEDFYGKWLLREGDLRPEEINKASCDHYSLDIQVLSYFKDIGLIFNTQREALMFWDRIEEIRKHTILQESDITYEEIEKLAIDDLVNGPQETLLKVWQKEKRYKEAFKKILAEKGFVTDEDINKELKKISFKEVKPRIYISGPISGHNIEDRRWIFKQIEIYLEVQGYEPVNPMENGLPAEATTHEHMKRDIELLMTCDYIYMMRRWTHSKGCKVEFDVATAIGLPVLFEESGEITKFE